MRTILFVDDEPKILEGLQRMLRPMRKEWEMAFAGSGQEALELMARSPVDVIVTDMRMPGMDGAALLSEVIRRHPETVRFVLSGQSDKDTVFRSAGLTHQFLAKPCDPDLLKAIVDRAFALRDLMGNEKLERLVSQTLTLPSLPGVYTVLMKELASPDASVAAVGKIIEGDVGMTAKLLQWANSALFGIPQHITNPTQAASLLGLDTIKSLVLIVGVFSQAAEARLPAGFSLETLSRHSMLVGAYAKAISRNEGADKKDISHAFEAGVLHDSGMLVLASNCPEEYRHTLARVHEWHVEVSAAEQEFFGATHSEIGAYLLGLWGFPDPVVEAVAFHHTPRNCPSRVFCPLTAVHVGNGLQHETPPRQPGGEPASESAPIDVEYLKGLGLHDRVPVWREICSSLCKGRVD